MHSRASTPTSGQQVYPHQTHSPSCRTSRSLSNLRFSACSHRCFAFNDKPDASKLCIEQGRNAIQSVTLACILLLSQPSQAIALPEESIHQCQQVEQANNVIAELAGFFTSEERDPIEAFTLYGTTFKKFVIEKLQGEKIISRQRGFTVDTCVSSARASEETPSFQFLPIGEKVQNTELGVICKHAEGTELKSTCLTSCEAACEAGLQKWETDNQIRTGFVLLDKDRTRLVKSCTRECTTDCTRPGKAYDFAIPFRK